MKGKNKWPNNFAWIAIGLLLLIGALLLVKNTPVLLNNSVPSQEEAIVPVTDAQLDIEFKKVNSGAAELDKSLNDSPIDVMQ